jgi:hypothetical protein
LSLLIGTCKVGNMDGIDGRRTEDARNRDISRETTDLDASEEKDDTVNQISLMRPSTDQRPVSIIGWGMALVFGALIWLIAFYLLRG